MKRTIAILTAAMMTTALGSLPALAAGTDHNGGVMGTTNGMSTDNTGAMSNGSAASNEMKSGSMSDGQDMMSTGSTTSSDQSMMSADEMVSSIKGLKNVSSVKVISLADMGNSDSKVTSPLPVNTTPEEQARIQAAIEANSALSSQLQAQSIDPSQIVAANVNAKTVTVYVK